jgi:hypothetical protein
MPVYFFDIYEDGRFIPDMRGMELVRLDQVEREAAEAAAVIAQDRLPGSNAQTVRVKVRDESDRHVVTATATLSVERIAGSNRR